jgi:peptidoglycan/LPS O-acetylase OafA/YrhL
VKQAFARLLAIAGFVTAVVAFFIDAERPATNPWLLFIVGAGVAVVGIILIAFDRRAR